MCASKIISLQCLAGAVRTVIPQLRGTQLDQGVSAQAQVPSAPPLGTRRETALREKVKGKLKEMCTLATGQDQPVTATRPVCLSIQNWELSGGC